MTQRRDIRSTLEPILNAKSVAVVGVSSRPGVQGNQFWEGLKDFNYQGVLYAVGTGGGEIRGDRIYQNIKDVPGTVDYVICAIPSKHTPQLVEDCGQKSVKGIHFYTSGFGEVEDKVGEELQKELLIIARKYNITIIGPNCMGIYYPANRLTFSIGFSPESGHVGFLSQSGGQSISGIREAGSRGIFFSKVISYGNAADINECDLIEYFTDDPDTRIITVYIEGTRDGRRLIGALKNVTPKKPVIVFKGASTEGAKNAAMSHTSSIAGSGTTWNSMLRQTGVIRVDNVQEMFDVVTILQRCPEPRGINALLMGHGGGACVQASDDACRSGLKLPMLPDEVRQTLRGIYGSDTGRIFRNPLDLAAWDGKWDLNFAALEKWGGADLFILHATPEQMPFVTREFTFNLDIDSVIARKKLTTKPVLVAQNVSTVEEADGMPERNLIRYVKEGVAAFPSVRRAATAYIRVYNYCQWLRSRA